MVRRLLFLNALAIVGAVCHHAVVWVVTGMFWWTDRYVAGVTIPHYGQVGSAPFYALRLIDQIASCAVPAFLCVSGYFIGVALARARLADGWKTVLNRLKTLVPPYVLWSLVLLGLDAVQGKTHSASAVGWAILTGTATPPFYYVPLLVQLLVLAPVLVVLARKRWPWLLTVTGALIMATALSHDLATANVGFSLSRPMVQRLQNSLISTYAFWFVLGLVASTHIGPFKAFLARRRRYLPALLLAAYALSFIEWEALRHLAGRNWISGGLTLADNFLALVLLLTFFAYDSLALPQAERMNGLGVMSYGVYLVHVLVLEVVARSVYHVLPRLLALPVLFEAILVLFGVALPVLLMTAVNRTGFRRYYALAFG